MHLLVMVRLDFIGLFSTSHGVAERKNMPICEVAKVMIHDQDLPMSLWVEASSIVVYVQNKSPHRILGDKTPEEAFTSVKLEVNHLRIFGCSMYIHVPKEKRSKMEPSGKEGTFVGYSETSKAFPIYVPGQRQIEVNRDVTFDKEVALWRSRESHMEIDSEEQEYFRDANISILDIHPSNVHREEAVDPVAPVDSVEPLDRLGDVAVAKRRLAWLCDTL